MHKYLSCQLRCDLTSFELAYLSCQLQLRLVCRNRYYSQLLLISEQKAIQNCQKTLMFFLCALMCNLYIPLVSQLEPGKDNGEQKKDTLQTNTEIRHAFLATKCKSREISHQKCTWKEEQETILRHNVNSVEFTVVHNAQLLPVLLLTQSQLGNLQSRGKEGLQYQTFKERVHSNE